jgi:hypothetical protein
VNTPTLDLPFYVCQEKERNLFVEKENLKESGNFNLFLPGGSDTRKTKA